MRRAPVALVLTAALVLGLVACGDDDEGTDAGTPTTAATGSSASDPGDPATTAAGDGSTTTTEAGGETTTTAEGDLPGEPIDIYPYEGAALAVVGVAADDTLNVRSGPGTGFDVLTELGPLADGFVATGRNRDLGDSLWVEVEADGTTGWVNVAYVAQPGSTVDVTADIPATSAATVAALAEAVAAGRAGEGEGPTPTVTIVEGPTDTEVTVDLVGLADDAQKGERLHVVATAGAGGFTATVVEATALCARGVTDGLCA